MADPVPPAERSCIECGGPMERGFIADMGHGSITQALWVRGVPEKSWLSGSLKIKKKAQYHVETFRCAHCGALRSYAFPPDV